METADTHGNSYFHFYISNLREYSGWRRRWDTATLRPTVSAAPGKLAAKKEKVNPLGSDKLQSNHTLSLSGPLFTEARCC